MGIAMKAISRMVSAVDMECMYGARIKHALTRDNGRRT